MSEEITKTGFSGTGRSGQGRREVIKIGSHASKLMINNVKENDEMMNQFLDRRDDKLVSPEQRIQFVRHLIATNYGIDDKDAKVPDKLGIQLSSESQRAVLFGILKLMTQTDYRGTQRTSVQEVFLNQRPELMTSGFRVRTGKPSFSGSYKNIQTIPVLVVTRNELMIASGFNPRLKSDRRNFYNAIEALSQENRFLVWRRFQRDENGNIVTSGKTTKRRRAKGTSQYELVTEISPLIKKRDIVDPVTLKTTRYEIQLNPVFLDEISPIYGGEGRGYFLLLPDSCQIDISNAYRKMYPSKKGFVPPLIPNLCFWLRYESGEIKRFNRNPFTKNPKEGVLQISLEDLAKKLFYEDKSIRFNKKQIKQYLEDGATIARNLGYIKDFSTDILTGEYIFELNLEFMNKEEQELEKNEI